MREVQQILRLWDRAKQAGEGAVLATVVKTRGSSYRLPGARLLLTKTGERAGSVSGGCLEGDLTKKAWWLTEAGPALRRYDTNAEGEIEGGYGLGCNGIIHVLLDRLRPTEPNVLDVLQTVRTGRQPAAVARILAPGNLLGRKLIVTTDGQIEHDLEVGSLAADLATQARLALAARSSGVWLQDETEVFIETLLPPTRLLVFGAGDDAIPLTNMAGLLGWHTQVYDGRIQFARPERFPAAQHVYLRPVGSGLQADVAPIPIDEWTVAVLMTHSYSQDLDVLTQLAKQPPSYVGLLGPRKRSVRLLADAGLAPDHFGGHLYGPMGLDIGADGSDQVALAVLSEIQAVLNNRNGSPLRVRQGSIHSSEEDEVSEVFTVRSIACA